jgi:hypothetical protein
MTWNGRVAASPGVEDIGRGADAILDASIAAVIFHLIDCLTIQTQNPGFDIPFRDQVRDSFSIRSSDVERLVQLPLAFRGLVIIRIDDDEQSRRCPG